MHVLETERLLFRDHEDADIEPYCEMESDPEYRAPQRVHPREELERSFREGWLSPKPMACLPPSTSRRVATSAAAASTPAGATTVR